MTEPAPTPPKRRRMLLWTGIVLGVLVAVLGIRAYVRGTVIEPERASPEGLKPGEVETRLFERRGARWIQLSSVIDAPIEKVWKVVHDHERMPEFMPRMAKLRVLEEKGDHKRVRIDFSMLWIDRYTEIDVEVEVNPRARIETWEQYAGTLVVNRGRWILESMGPNQTFARYEVCASSGLPVPGWMERAALRDALPVILTRVGQRIREIGPDYFKDAK